MHADLHAELWHAIQLARHEKVAPGLEFLKLPRRMQWGVAWVEFYGPDRGLYEPRSDGPSLAFIVPVVEDGDTVDLCAIDAVTQHVGTRLGIGRGLGLDAVADARVGCCELLLVERPLDWLRDPWRFDPGPPPERSASLYLFRLSDALVTLDGVPEFTCNTIALAERVQALFPPLRRESVLAPADG